MKKEKNPSLIEHYINSNKIENLFSPYIKDNLELFLFDKGDLIFKEGTEISHLMFFVEGKAKVYMTLENGKLMLISFYKTLDTLGDLELVTNDIASCNVEAIEPCVCLAIPVNIIRNKYEEDPKLLKFLCNSLASKLKRSSKNSSINLLYPLESRLASYIISIGVNENTKTFKFDDTLLVLSELLGTSYRHLLRTINKLIEKSLISKEKDYYRVLDFQGLKYLSADIYK